MGRIVAQEAHRTTNSFQSTRRSLWGLLGAAPLTLLSVGSAAHPRELDLDCYYSDDTPQGKGAYIFADAVEQASAGALRVRVDPSQLLVTLETIERASALAVYCAPCVAKSEPVLSLSALPMVAAMFEEAETLLRIARPYYSAALARHGQVLLATQPWRPGALWSNVPIRTVADFRGALFALASTSSIGNDAGWERPFIRLGARSASYSDAEVVLSSDHTGSMKLTQEFSYFTEIFFAAHLTFITARRKVFEALSDVQRHALVEAGRKAERSLWKLMRVLLPLEQREIARRGVLVSAQPPIDLLAALRSAAEPDIQSWSQSIGADGAAIVAEYRRALGAQSIVE